MLSTSIMKKQRMPVPEFDHALMWIVTALLSIGLVMVYSSSIAIAETMRGQSTYFLVRHGMFIGVGLLAGLCAFQVPVQTWQKLAPYLFGLGVLMLVLVLVPFIGREINGSRRWIPLLIVNLQPSELMKLFVVLYAADYTVRRGGLKNHLFKAFWPIFLVMALVGFLLLLEPDMGGFVVICAIALSILFLGGFNLKVFAGLMVALPIAFAALIKYSPYRMERIIGFLDPWADPFGKGYQLSHSLIAFGRGEWLGVGLGASVEKLFYLPEAYSDFLLAVIAEELGVVGVLAIIALFVGLVMRSFAIGRQSAFLGRPFAALLAQGMGIWLGIQAMINMGVNMGVLPPKGLTLPFLSFGGSSMLVNCVAIAILLRVDFENRMMMRGQTV